MAVVHDSVKLESKTTSGGCVEVRFFFLRKNVLFGPSFFPLCFSVFESFRPLISALLLPLCR